MKTRIAKFPTIIDTYNVLHFDSDKIDQAIEFVQKHIDTNGNSDYCYTPSFHVENVVVDAHKLAKRLASRCPNINLVIAEHCNLHCKYCLAAAPLVRTPCVADMGELTTTLNHLRTICGEEHAPLSFILFGGEPTLHPQLGDIAVMIRDMFPSTELVMNTNGILLPTLSKKTLNALQTSNCHVSLSVRMLNKSSFLRTCYSRTPTSFDGRLCNHRPNTVCIINGKFGAAWYSQGTKLYANGDILFCGSAGAAYTMQKHELIQNILVDGDDFVNIHSLHTFDDLDTFFNKDMSSFCRYCNISKLTSGHMWSQSLDQTVDDWFE